MEEGPSALKREREIEREASIKGLAQRKLSYATVNAVYFLQLGLNWRQLIFVFSPTLRKTPNDSFSARKCRAPASDRPVSRGGRLKHRWLAGEPLGLTSLPSGLLVGKLTCRHLWGTGLKQNISLLSQPLFFPLYTSSDLKQHNAPEPAHTTLERFRRTLKT